MGSSSIDISVVMVDGGFRENFSFVPTWLDQTFAEKRYEVIWVDYTNAVADEVCEIPEIRTFALDRHEEPQILAYAFNKGIQEARGEIIILPDADVACEPTLLQTVWKEISTDPEMVLYVLRLDQPKHHFKGSQTFDELKQTCSIKHTYNYGGCTAVAKKHLIKMNGYEQLPFFSGYHYNGGDNYIRFKNMGLKVRWHPEQRVYHAWHPTPPSEKFQTITEQERFIRHRAATWDWKAYSGIDASEDRSYDSSLPYPSEWNTITTERGPLRPDASGAQQGGSSNDGPDTILQRLEWQVDRRGVLRGGIYVLGRALESLGYRVKRWVREV